MPEKSSSDFCCCDGCQAKPEIWDHISVPVLADISAWKKHCCSCVPEFADVTIFDSSNNAGGGIFKLWCRTVSTLGMEQPLYQKVGQGGILVGSVVVDVTFHIRIRDRQCILYIKSERLNIGEDTYGSSKVIDAAARAYPNEFCSTLSNDGSSDGGRSYTEFTVGGYRIRLSAADHIPIRGRDHCYDANGVTVFDTDPIRDLCCNCNCICRCMCLTVTSPGFIIIDNEPIAAVSSASVACIYNNTFTFENGMKARIGPLDGLSHDNIISCWDLDEVSGSRLDTFNVNSLSESTPIASDAGKLNAAAVFNGTGVLFKNHDPTLQLFGISATVCLWVKPADISGDMSIISKTAGNGVSGFGWKIWYSSSLGKIIFSISNGTAVFSVISTATVAVGAWYFIAATINNDAKVITISVGTQDTQVESFSGSVASTTCKFMLGGQDSSTTPELFIGSIDQVSLWKKNLQDAEIAAIYNDNKGRACNYDDRCYLIITDLGPLSGPLPSPFVLDEVTNPCPRPAAQWTFWQPPTAQISYERPVFMSLRCANEKQCTVDIAACCPSGRSNFPSTLIADVETGCYACPNITVSLVWDYSINKWQGYADFCGHLMVLSIDCGFASIGFSSSPCVVIEQFGLIPRIGEASCDPVLAVFSGQLSGIFCCTGVTVGINIITITVYE